MTDFKTKHNECKIIFFKELFSLLNNNAWSKDLINNAENNCKFSHEYHYILFPDGDLQILQEFESWLDDRMLSALNKIERPKKIRDQIALALETRIIDLITKDAAISISAYHILPQNICAANESAFKTCDVIWKYAGDKSTDFNYYSKRGLLFPVYLSAKAFYFADKSTNHEKTKEFIQNALDNIINIASFKNKIKLPELKDIPILRLFS